MLPLWLSSVHVHEVSHAALIESVQDEPTTVVAGGLLTGVAAAEAPLPADQCSAAATISDDRRLVVVAHGFDSQYWASWQGAPSGFQPWRALGSMAFASGPAVVQDARGDVVVFGRAAGGRLHYATLHPGGGLSPGWTDLGGALSGRPAPILDSRGLLHVFAQSASFHSLVYKRQLVNGSSVAWGSWQLLEGAVSSAPHPSLDAEGWLHLMARGPDGSLWHRQQVEASGSEGWEWCPWAPLGLGLPLGSLPRVPRALNAQSFVELFVRGPDRALWHKRQALANESTVGWSAWRRLGGMLAGAPAAAVASDGLITVFVRGVEGGVWMTQQGHHPVSSSADAWTSWSKLPGDDVHAAAPEAVTDGKGLLHLFSRAADGAMLHATQAAVLGSSNASCAEFPAPWASLGGRFRGFQC